MLIFNYVSLMALNRQQESDDRIKHFSSTKEKATKSCEIKRKMITLSFKLFKRI